MTETQKLEEGSTFILLILSVCVCVCSSLLVGLFLLRTFTDRR